MLRAYFDLWHGHAIRRSAMFEDLWSGKTIQGLWSANVTCIPTSHFDPDAALPLARRPRRGRTVFDIDGDSCSRRRDEWARSGHELTALHLFSPEDFGGALLVTSSSIPDTPGAKTSAEITSAFHRTPSVVGTATAAPNDYIELGTSSEASGISQAWTCSTSFQERPETTARRDACVAGHQRRLKGHAEVPFGGGSVTWARAMRKPSGSGIFG